MTIPMTMKVHFVHAPDPRLSEYQNFGNKYMPVWAFVLAAHVPEEAGFELDLFDTRIDAVDDISAADVFVMSGLNQDFDHVRRVHSALQARHPAARFLVGGPMCWSFDKAGELDKLDFFDHVVIGDGEEVIAGLLADLRDGVEVAAVTRVPQRFDLDGARPMHRQLAEKHAKHYYGATVEVSRGCPFLCEFCDIRILQDNNRAHNMPPELIVREMDALAKLGVTQFMFACDNFIGDLRWAHQTCDRLLEWIAETGVQPSILTWLTINLYKDPALMAKMRRAGFDVLFIGVESFDQNSLLETAKVQNCTRDEMPGILRDIQSYGFVVTPGLIFGFDSDSPRLYELTTDGLEQSCLLTANPSLLIALPGTPLYRRMKLAGRLREGLQHIGRFKFQSNIRYLLPRDVLVGGYIDFVRRVSDGGHQFRRLASYFDNLERGNFIPLRGGGYGNLPEYLRSMLRNRVALTSFSRRLWFAFSNPRNLYYVLKGLGLVFRRRVDGGLKMFLLWLYGWSNFAMQHRRIGPADFDVECMEDAIERRHILPDGYDDRIVEDIPANKTRAQLRNTVAQLERLVAELPHDEPERQAVA
jgi:radical SAM superfamily enzyme YgiQ (UPF0313 family)